MGDKDREQFDKLVSFVVPSLVAPLDAINETILLVGAAVNFTFAPDENAEAPRHQLNQTMLKAEKVSNVVRQLEEYQSGTNFAGDRAVVFTPASTAKYDQIIERFLERIDGSLSSIEEALKGLNACGINSELDDGVVPPEPLAMKPMVYYVIDKANRLAKNTATLAPLIAPGVTPVTPALVSAPEPTAAPSTPREKKENGGAAPAEIEEEKPVEAPASPRPAAAAAANGTASSADVASLKLQIATLETKLTKKTDEVKELKTRLKESEGSSSRGADFRISQLEEDLTTSREALEKEKSNREKLEADYKEVKKQHAGCAQKTNIQVTLLQDQIAKLEEEIEYQKKNVQIEIFNKEQVEEELDTVKKDMGRMQAELKAIQNAATKKAHEATALQRNVSSATEEKQNLKNRVEQLEGELEQALQALEVEKYNNAVLTQEVAKYKSGAAELQAKTMTAQENLTAKAKELAQAQETIKGHDRLIKQLETELAKAQTDLEAELQNRQQMETELADLYVKQEEAAATTQTLEETRAQLDEAIANLETFENQAMVSKQQLDAQSAAKGGVEQRLVEVTQQLEETKAYLEAETFNKEQAQQEVLDLKKNAAADRDKMEKAIKEAKNQVRESRAIPQMQQISAEFTALQEQLEAEAAQKDELENQVRELQRQLDTSSADLNRQKQRLEGELQKAKEKITQLTNEKKELEARIKSLSESSTKTAAMEIELNQLREKVGSGGGKANGPSGNKPPPKPAAKPPPSNASGTSPRGPPKPAPKPAGFRPPPPEEDEWADEPPPPKPAAKAPPKPAPKPAAFKPQPPPQEDVDEWADEPPPPKPPPKTMPNPKPSPKPAAFRPPPPDPDDEFGDLSSSQPAVQSRAVPPPSLATPALKKPGPKPPPGVAMASKLPPTSPSTPPASKPPPGAKPPPPGAKPPPPGVKPPPPGAKPPPGVKPPPPGAKPPQRPPQPAGDYDSSTAGDLARPAPKGRPPPPGSPQDEYVPPPMGRQKPAPQPTNMYATVRGPPGGGPPPDAVAALAGIMGGKPPPVGIKPPPPGAKPPPPGVKPPAGGPPPRKPGPAPPPRQ